jgi:UDP-N-acetyl-D-mannosaminuronic acid dehydrogenase
MLINEGLVLYIVEQLARKYTLAQMTVGLLGMSFKADSDDVRSSLSYKLKKTLLFRSRGVLTTDPYVTTDPELSPLSEVIAGSDLLILCAPHSDYHNLDVGGRPLVDIWNLTGNGTRI